MGGPRVDWRGDRLFARPDPHGLVEPPPEPNYRRQELYHSEYYIIGRSASAYDILSVRIWDDLVGGGAVGGGGDLGVDATVEVADELFSVVQG